MNRILKGIVGDDLVIISAQFVLSVHQKEIPIIKDFKTLNDIHLPTQEVGLVMGGIWGNK